MAMILIVMSVPECIGGLKSVKCIGYIILEGIWLQIAHNAGVG